METFSKANSILMWSRLDDNDDDDDTTMIWRPSNCKPLSPSNESSFLINHDMLWKLRVKQNPKKVVLEI